MDFTREPIIETIITPKEGYKLVVKNSRIENQEDYVVDAVEIVSFSGTPFFRSLERPRAFLLPVADFEVTEVRETRMVLKTPGSDRSIKIGGGREGGSKPAREQEKNEESSKVQHDSKKEESSSASPVEGSEESHIDPRLEKKRDRRRQSRKRRGRDEPLKEGQGEPVVDVEGKVTERATFVEGTSSVKEDVPQMTPSMFSALLQPPPTLISETINRYRENDLFKGAFYLTEEEQYKPHDKVEELLREEEVSSFPAQNEEPLSEEIIEDGDNSRGLSLFEEEERGSEEENINQQESVNILEDIESTPLEKDLSENVPEDHS